MEDIDFEELFCFFYNYCFIGEDEEYICYYFQELVLCYFVVEKGWSFEGLGYYLVFYKYGKFFSGDIIFNLYCKGL